MLAVIASGVGALFASQASPIVIAMLSQPDRPIRLVLDSGWRALDFGIVLTLAVTLLFGIAPALRASAAKPVAALKTAGSGAGPGAGTWTLIGLQVAFSTFLLVAAALFAATFGHLLTRPLGFSAQGVLLLNVEAPRAQPAAFWTAAARQMRQVAGVESAAIASWTPLSGNRWHGEMQVPGAVDRAAEVNFVDIGPSYFDAMGIGMVDGRDFAAGDAGVVIVNEAFARALFDGASPLGRRVLRHVGKDPSLTPVTIIGLVRDAVYMSVRESPPPTMYVPLEPRAGATLIVRTGGVPASMAPAVRRALAEANPALRVRAAERFGALVEQQMMRERLLATLSAFFAAIALLIAGLGLYGVLNGTVARQRRDLGIRLALGARAPDIIRRIATHTVVPVCVGAAAGLAAGVVFGRAARSLLFEIVPGQPTSVVMPLLVLTATVLAAMLPAALRASRIDPAASLRSE
jgi:predicted permease